MPVFGGSSQTKEKALEALNQNKQLQQEMAMLEGQISRLNTIVQAMWELLKQKTDLTDVQIEEKVLELQRAAETAAKVAESCPACKRTLQANSKACIYCGTLVEKRRLF